MEEDPLGHLPWEDLGTLRPWAIAHSAAEVTFGINAPCLRLHGFILYALGVVLDLFYFLFVTWVAIFGVTKNSNEAEGVAALANMLEWAGTAFVGANVLSSCWGELGS